MQDRIPQAFAIVIPASVVETIQEVEASDFILGYRHRVSSAVGEASGHGWQARRQRAEESS